MPNPHFVVRDQCPACHGSRWHTLYAAPMDQPPISEYLRDFYTPQGNFELPYIQDAQYVLLECDDCGLVFQQQIPDDFLSHKLYEEWLDPHRQFAAYEQRHPHSLYRGLAQEMLFIASYFGSVPADIKVFDFGMGWGTWCRMALAFGFQTFGGEISTARIEYAARFGVPNLPWHAIPGAGLHFINSEQVFEHLPQPLDMLRHLKSGLRPGGLIRLSVPDAREIPRPIQPSHWRAPKGSIAADRPPVHPITPLEHINCYSQAALVKLAAAAGLQRADLPARALYASYTDLTPGRRLLKNLVRPFYMRRYYRGTTLIFRNPAAP